VIAGSAWKRARARRQLINREQRTLRTAVEEPGGHQVVLALGDQAEDALGGPWLLDHIDKLEDDEFVLALGQAQCDVGNDRWAWHYRNVVGTLGRDLYLAVGRRLRGNNLLEWCLARLRTDRPTVASLIKAFSHTELLAALGDTLVNPQRCASLPGMPLALARTPEAEAPSWGRVLVARWVGALKGQIRRAEALLDEGFTGSFEELRREVRSTNGRRPQAA
jgi:hypothetical protein